MCYNRVEFRETELWRTLMRKIDILCPDCGKLITKVSEDSRVTVYGYCRRCKAEKTITYPYKRAIEPNVPK